MTEQPFIVHRSNGSWGRYDDAGEVRAVCTCGWRGAVRRSITQAALDLDAHLDEQFRITEAARIANERKVDEVRAELVGRTLGTPHAPVRQWPLSDGKCRAHCTCGWRSALLSIAEAREAMQTHLEVTELAEKIADNPRKPHDNPDLPRLLRAIANGTDAQKSQTHHIFRAAADELDYWRAEHAAQCNGGRNG